MSKTIKMVQMGHRESAGTTTQPGVLLPIRVKMLSGQKPTKELQGAEQIVDMVPNDSYLIVKSTIKIASQN